MSLETIEVRYKYTNIDSAGNAGGNTGGPDSAPYYHKYIVYTDSDGVQHAARGGTTLRFNGYPTPFSPLGKINTVVGEFVDGFPDFHGNNNPPHPGEIIAQGNDLSSAWNSIQNTC